MTIQDSYESGGKIKVSRYLLMPRNVSGAARRVHLLIGPTSVGKTDRAVQLALEKHAPVVVLDRIQCHYELPSARPDPAELRNTTRIYLEERPLSTGTLTEAEAYERLESVLRDLWAKDIIDVVIEGGSISLLAEVMTHASWCADAEVMIELITPADYTWYEQRVRARVEATLPRTIDEMRDLVRDETNRRVLAGIVGTREILAALPGLDDSARGRRDEVLKKLVDRITEASLLYAREQSRYLSKIDWTRMALDREQPSA